MRRMLVVGIAALMLAGCGGPTLDGTSEASLSESMEKIGAQLPQEQRLKFVEDLKLITLSKIGEAFSGAIAPEQTADSLRAELNGKTVEQIAAMADALRAARAQRQKEQAQAEIKQLQAIEQAAQQAAVEMAKFQILTSEFYFAEKNKTTITPHGQPVVVAKVLNGTPYAVARVGFKGTVASPGRATPWFVGTVEIPIPGGIEPGESPTWEITPNMYTDWGKLSAPQGALFSLEIIKLEGADGALLFDASGLSEAQAQRLAQLQSQYPAN